ncbi:hypothetical protein Leryth_001158 [Lithospermum erythrorhizon]|nr:hypothetical protein Leryth_001158 [Lithospermum erythrorhizon]
MRFKVTIFLLVFIVLAGAGLGYWIVRKFVVSEDGTVDVGIAQFVKWAIRIIAVTSISQSTRDTPLATALVCCCMTIRFLVTSIPWSNFSELPYSVPSMFLRNGGRSNMRHQRAEFYSPTRMGSRGLKSIPNGLSRRAGYSVRGTLSPSTGQATKGQQDFYSTFHKTPERKKFSKKEWDKFTQQSTRQAVSELGASPEFSRWVIKNARRIQLLPEDSLDDSPGSKIRSSPEDRPDDSLSSDSGSSDETAIESSSGVGLFKWHGRR